MTTDVAVGGRGAYRPTVQVDVDVWIPPEGVVPDCASVDPDLFFPEVGAGRQGTVRALRVCAGCALRVECGDAAVRQFEVHGVWGGRSAQQRSRARNGFGVVDRVG